MQQDPPAWYETECINHEGVKAVWQYKPEGESKSKRWIGVCGPCFRRLCSTGRSFGDIRRVA